MAATSESDRQPSGQGPRKFISEEWAEFRDSGIKPLHISSFSGSEDLYKELLDGADALGVTDLQPQQLVIFSAVNARTPDGTPLYQRCGVSVPRRAGKSTVVWAMILGRLINRKRYKITYVGQSLSKGYERFIDDVIDMLEITGVDFDAKDSLWKVNRQMGRASLTYKPTGSKLSIKAAKQANVRGDSIDLAVFDEAQEHSAVLSSQLLGAVLPTFDTRPNSQLLIVGTAGSVRQGMLWDTLEMGRAGTAGIVEYAAPDDTPDWEEDESPDGTVADPAIWALAHPGLGNLTPVSIMQDRFNGMSRGDFTREYLGLWPAGTTNALISPVKWAACGVDDPMPTLPKHFFLAVSVDFEGRCATICAAFKDGDTINVGIVDHRVGTGWVARRAAELSRTYGVPIVYDGSSGTNGNFAENVERLRPKPKLEPKSWAEVSNGAAALLASINAGTVRHFNQPELTDAVKGARKRNVKDGSDAKRWSFGKVDAESIITPVLAMSLAVHATMTAKPRIPLPTNVTGKAA